MTELLQVAARSGFGRRGPSSGGGRRMIVAHRKRILFAAIALALVWTGWDVLSGLATPPNPGGGLPAPELTSPAPTQPAITPTPTHESVQAKRRTYALPLPDIAGLSPDAPPGSSLELWVTWEPPVTKRPKLQKLVTGLVLDRIVPPVTPEGPPVVIMSVPRAQIDELVWADRYGTLSAVMRGG